MVGLAMPEVTAPMPQVDLALAEISHHKTVQVEVG
jgi:hypothetical protein